MFKKYGRLWSIAAAAVLFVFILASLTYYHPTRQSLADSIVNSDEQKQEVDDVNQNGEEHHFAKLSHAAHTTTSSAGTSTATTSPTPDATQAETAKEPGLVQADGSTPTSTDATVTAPTPTPVDELSKTLVIGRLQSEDTEWVGRELGDWQNAIYYVDLAENETSPSGLRTKMNKAREAMPYLTYMIDNYHNLPDVNVFLHPHRDNMPQAWHNDARGHSAVHMINELRLETVISRGYVNLRCNNEVGCPEEIRPFRDPPEEKLYAEHAFPYIYAQFFHKSFEEMREEIPVVATQCCAQFAVSKEQILKRPKEDYESYREYLEQTPYDDATAGRVMEYMWHIIFGQDAVHCENVFQCWCEVYGRCNTFGRPIGQYLP